MENFKEEVQKTIDNYDGKIGILGYLGLIFVTLKLVGVITWSWWLVTLPFWGGIALVIGISIIALLFVLLVDGIQAIFTKEE
jgi:hypothetical protein